MPYLNGFRVFPGIIKKYLTDLYYYGSLNYVETINGGERAMKKVHINITIDEDLNDWIEKMALELRLNKSQFINNALSVAKSDAKILKGVGLFEVAKAAIKLKEECSKVGMKFRRISWMAAKKETT